MFSYINLTFAAGCESSLRTFISAGANSDNVFNQLDKFEGDVETIFSELAERYQKYPESTYLLDQYGQELNELGVFLDRLQTKALNDEPINLNEVHEISIEIKRLRESISSFRGGELKVVTAKVTWEDILNDPHLIVADKVYTVELHTGGSLQISFSSKIVREVLTHEDSSRALYTKKALPQIAKGIMGGAARGAGLKRLIINESVIELAVIGKDAGRIRVGGYMNNNVLRMVHWANGSDHSSTSYIMRFRDSVLSSMD